MDVELTLLAFQSNNLLNPIEVARDGAEVLGRIPRCCASMRGASGSPVP